MIRRIISFMATCIVLLSVLLTNGASAADRVSLKLRLQEGQTYKSRFVSEQKIKQTIEGRVIETTQTMGFAYSFEVKQVQPDGTALCRVRHDSVLVKQDGPAGKMEYDSTNPPTTIPSEAKAFAAIVGEGYDLRITPMGHVSEVSGVDEMIEKIIMAVDMPDEKVRELARKQLKEQFGDEAVRAQMEQILAVYPDVPIVVGDSWQRHVTISTDFPIVVDNTYTLRGREGGEALIDIQSKLSKNPSGKPMKAGQATIDFEVTGTQEGKMWMSESTGWVEKSELTQKFSGTIKLSGAPGMAEAMSWPISVEATLRIESLK